MRTDQTQRVSEHEDIIRNPQTQVRRRTVVDWNSLEFFGQSHWQDTDIDSVTILRMFIPKAYAIAEERETMPFTNDELARQAQVARYGVWYSCGRR